MKILLIPPIMKYTDEQNNILSLSDFPTGFAYIASALEKAGHEVFGLNLNNRFDYHDKPALVKDKIPKAIEQVKPDLIGVGGICTDYAFIRDTINAVRGCSDIPIVLGGGIISNDREVFDILKPDYAIVGEADDAIVDLVKTLETNVVTLPMIIDAEPPDLEKLPFPDYEPFGIDEMMDDYSQGTRLLYRYSRQYPRPYNIVTARSCPFNCTFCQHSRGVPYRARSIDNIMKEIKEAYKKYNFNILIILDELFVANKKRMNEFCTKLIESKEKYGWDFDWMFQTHANSKLNKESLDLAKQAGCFFFSYGLESGSQRVLDSMRKKTTVAQAIEAIRLAEEAEVGFGGNLIFGDPAETEETISESLAFWYEHCRTSEVFLSFISPYPGSEVFDYCVEKGLIPHKKQYYENIDKYGINMTSMTAETFQAWATLIGGIEKAWLQAKETHGKITVDKNAPERKFLQVVSGEMYFVEAVCPYCKRDITYRQVFSSNAKNVWMGAGCPECNKRIKVTV